MRICARVRLIFLGRDSSDLLIGGGLSLRIKCQVAAGGSATDRLEEVKDAVRRLADAVHGAADLDDSLRRLGTALLVDLDVSPAHLQGKVPQWSDLSSTQSRR